MWCLLGNLSHPNPGAKLLELDPPKGLGEKVSELILGVDIAGLDASLIQAAPNEVVLDSDMLAALMEDGVLRQGQGGLAIHPELHGVLRIWDRHRRLLAKVNRGANRLYVLHVQVAQPVCLAARRDEDGPCSPRPTTPSGPW